MDNFHFLCIPRLCLDSANSTASYFDVRAVNGKLYLNRQVDFENLAERKFDFGVAVSNNCLVQSLP